MQMTKPKIEPDPAASSESCLPSLFALADDANKQLIEEGVPRVDLGYQVMDHVDVFSTALQACEIALREPGIHKLCSPMPRCRREFCLCVAAALKSLEATVERFESTDSDEYAWLLSNLSLILVVEKDNESN